MGEGALATNTTGGSNTALGRDAMYSNTTAHDNVAVGKKCFKRQYNWSRILPWAKDL